MKNLETVSININELINDPTNARTHDEKNLKAVMKSIKKFGQVEPLVVNKKNNQVIGGNCRLVAMKKLGFESVSVHYVDFNDKESKALAIALNRTAELAGWDNEELDKQLKDMDEELRNIAFEDYKFEDEVKEGLTDGDAIPENVETRVKVGDLWLLGDHRLLCGDSTDILQVERLMGGDKADMVFTDPPYGVSYTKKTKDVFGSSSYTEIKNDDKSGDDLKDFFRSIFISFISIMSDTCSYYVCSPQGGDSEMMMMMMMRETGMKCRHQIIWVKDSPVFSMGRLDYDYKHEPILYGWMKRHSFRRKGSQDKSVWEFKRTENKLHPTMKPVELIENAILNSSDLKQLIVDLFLGSGSTLIACEKTNRKCRGSEIDAHY
jgi:DNA modification methylase